MRKIIYAIWILAVMVSAGCTDDLNQYPQIKETSESVYSNPDNYISGSRNR
jgi:hypothetical protein